MSKEYGKFALSGMVALADYVRIKAGSDKHGDARASEGRKISAHMSYVLTMQRLDLGIPFGQIVDSGADAFMSKLREWISVYDDVIDSAEQYPSKASLKHAQIEDGSRASEPTKELVGLIRSIPSREKQKNLVRSLSKFRREEYDLNLELWQNSRNNGGTFCRRIEDLKLESSGLSMSIIAQVMNTVWDVEGEKAKRAEQGFHAFGAAGQYLDDLADFERDAGDAANLIVNAAKQFPREYRLLESEGFTRKNLRRCQDTLEYAETRRAELADEIPPEMAHTRRSVEVFARLIPLYSAFETKSYV